jgi:hypothetical protein
MLTYVKGDFLDDQGYLAGRGRLWLRIYDGKAYWADAFPCVGSPRQDARFIFSASELRCAMCAWSYLPDEGEIERVGVDTFAA